MLEVLSQRLLALPGCGGWTELEDILGRMRKPGLPPWDYSLVVYEAAGGQQHAAEPAAAAILCLAAGISLLDDILDDDPSETVDLLGVGRSANAAAALQAAAGQLLLTAPELTPNQRSASLHWLQQAAIGTARGQDLDTGPCDNESDYWRIVEAKSTPLIATATALGGIAANQEAKTIEVLANIGKQLGLMIQIQDDLTDAMSTPGGQDWQRPGHNLVLLYAMTTDHDQRQRFRELVADHQRNEALREAQLILTRCGAIAFCVHHLVALQQQILSQARGLGLPEPEKLLSLFARQIEPVAGLLRELGMDSPEDLWTP